MIGYLVVSAIISATAIISFLRYYKTIFLGLIDMALVSMYIVFKAHAKQQGRPTPRRDEFYETLQAQLLSVTAEDFEIFNVSSSC